MVINITVAMLNPTLQLYQPSCHQLVAILLYAIVISPTCKLQAAIWPSASALQSLLNNTTSSISSGDTMSLSFSRWLRM